MPARWVVRGSRARTRVEALRVRNFRVLRDFRLSGLTPFTVVLGPNGSGKSTILDVFGFLSESFAAGLRPAWEKRGRFRELRSRGADGPIVVEFDYREGPDRPLLTYHLALDEIDRDPRAR